MIYWVRHGLCISLSPPQLCSFFTVWVPIIKFNEDALHLLFVYCIEYTVIVTIYTFCYFLYWFLSQPLLPWHHTLRLLPVHAHVLITSRSSCSGLLQHGAAVCFFLASLAIIMVFSLFHQFCLLLLIVEDKVSR